MSVTLLTAGAGDATDRANDEQETDGAGRAGPRGGAPGGSPVHCLRDLDRTGRWVAALLAAALVLAPVLAVVHFLPDWAPATDNAFIALRAYDVGSDRTPMTGQPSFSSYYGGNEEVHVDHLGAWAFYGLAPFVRLLGLSAGMLAFAALVSGAVALLAPWVVFRLLGPRAGAVAAVVTALVLFTRGAGSLTNPLSSVFSGYPAFLAAVLVWALLCGDDRLIPLTVGVLSFAVQMHLAVGLMCAVLAVAGAAGVATNWWCASRSSGGGGGGAAWRSRRRALLGAGLVGAVLWLPVVVQQLFGEYPNLSALVEFGRDSDRAAQGGDAAVDHVVNVLGWPPLLGRTDFDPFSALYVEPPAVRWVTAAAVLAVVTAAGVVWARRSRRLADPGASAAAGRRALLAVAVGVMTLAGFLNSGNIPTSAEAFRAEFYHWVWPLTFLVTVTLALAAAEAVGPLRRARVPAGAGAVVAVAGLAVASVTLDRDANALQAMQAELPRDAYETLADGIAAHRDRLTGPVLLRTEGQLAIGLHHSALAAQLEARGIPVVLPSANLSYVAGQRLADTGTVESVLVLVVESLAWHPEPAELAIPGEEVAHYDVRSGAAVAYDELVAQLEDADRIVVGDELADRAAAATGGLGGLTPEVLRDHAREVLVDVPTLALLREVPLPSPRLDPEALARLHTSLDDAAGDARVNTTTTTALRVVLVTGDDVDRYLGRP